MAAPYNPPKKNEDFIIYVAVEDCANPGKLKTNPTIAAGDFRISKDGGAFADVATLPDVQPDGSLAIRIQLSATEMNCDNVFLYWEDQDATPEWCSGWLSIPTTQ